LRKQNLLFSRFQFALGKFSIEESFIKKIAPKKNIITKVKEDNAHIHGYHRLICHNVDAGKKVGGPTLAQKRRICHGR